MVSTLKHKYARGFTLVELMVTIAVVAILAAIAVPELRSFILRNELVNTTNVLRAAIARAQREADTRNTFVSVAPIAASGTVQVVWGQGYQIFVNPSINNTWAEASASGTVGAGTEQWVPTLVLQSDFDSSGSVGVQAANCPAVTFDARGRPVNAFGGPGACTIDLCIQGVNFSDKRRQIVVDWVGAIRIETAPTGTLSWCT